MLKTFLISQSFFILLFSFQKAGAEAQLQTGLNFQDTLKMDTKICNAQLDDPTSIKKYVTKKVFDLLESYKYKREQNSFPYFQIQNKNRTEIFKLTLLPGNDCCQIFSVGSNSVQNRNNSYIIPSKCQKFVTENGVSLGLSKNNFLRIFSVKKFEVIKKGDKDIFKFVNPAESGAGYIAIYVFKQSKLEKFIFGTYIEQYDYLKSIGEE